MVVTLAIGLQSAGLASRGRVRMLRLEIQSLSIFFTPHQIFTFSDLVNRGTLKITRKENPLWLWGRVEKTYE
jgi:hypothetical protein